MIMLLIIIPCVITILLVWYANKNILINGQKLMRIIRLLLIAVSFVPILNIISLCVCIILFFAFLEKIEFKETKTNRFLKG